MRSLIYALAIVGASFAVACMGVAQGPGGPPGGMRGGPGQAADRMARMRKMEDDMFAQLHVTPAQKHKIDAFRAERDAKMKKAFASMPKGGPGGPPAGGPPGGGRGGPGGGPGGGRGGPFRPIMEEYRNNLKTVLTKDQSAKMDDLRKAMRAKMGGGRPGGPGGPGGRPGGG